MLLVCQYRDEIDLTFKTKPKMILIKATLATMSRDSIKLGEIDLNVENILSLLEDKSVGVPSWLPLLLGQ